MSCLGLGDIHFWSHLSFDLKFIVLILLLCMFHLLKYHNYFHHLTGTGNAVLLL